MPTIPSKLSMPKRTLLGPGPSNVDPQVLSAMATPLVGHLDPAFLAVMDDVQSLLRTVFQTQNDWTLAVPGTGTAAMEAAIGNLVEPDDRVLACVHGYFGERLALMAERYGAEVTRLSQPWGEVFDPGQILAALRRSNHKIVTLVHAETSTGALQPGIAEIARGCHAAGALLVLDCVTSLGGLELKIDDWGVDVAYSAGQKCLSAPPGLSPLTVSPGARQVIESRRRPPAVFYLDLVELNRYWGEARAYHHTAPISTMYGLREALRLAVEEGLAPRYQRHQTNARLLWDGLETLGMELFVPADRRVPVLTTVRVPAGADEGQLRSALLGDYDIEIAGGFGPLAGQIWRIGLMGYSSKEANVGLLLTALKALLS